MKDNDGVTALMNAAESGSLEAVQALLDKGADAGAMSTTAFTPLIVAAAGGHLTVVKVPYIGFSGKCRLSVALTMSLPSRVHESPLDPCEWYDLAGLHSLRALPSASQELDFSSN